jgi:hypothetical protein
MEELRNSLPRLPLFAVFMRPTEKFQWMDSPEGAAKLKDHILFLLDLEDQGKMFASGPLDMNPATRVMEGMMILAVSTLEEAQAIAEREPFHQAGWRINQVRRWHLNEGAALPVARQLLGL